MPEVVTLPLLVCRKGMDEKMYRKGDSQTMGEGSVWGGGGGEEDCIGGPIVQNHMMCTPLLVLFLLSHC